MNNACVKFEERSLNRGGCVADENIISPKTYVSREYNNIVMVNSIKPDKIVVFKYHSMIQS